MRNLLVAPKDEDTFTKKSRVICRFKCTQAGCEKEYTGESGRTSGDWLKEHLRVPPPYMYTQMYCAKTAAIIFLPLRFIQFIHFTAILLFNI